MRFNFNKSTVAIKKKKLELKAHNMPLNMFSASFMYYFLNQIMFQKSLNYSFIFVALPCICFFAYI